MIEFLKGVLDRTGEVYVHFHEDVEDLLKAVDYEVKVIDWNNNGYRVYKI